MSSRSRIKTDPRIAKERRDRALARGELRTSTAERISPKGVTSFAIKAPDPVVEKAIKMFLEKRNGT